MNKTININISSNLIDVELQIKLLEYLKTKKFISDDMHHYVINKLLNKVELLK